ncbi:MAG: hypothetical protein LBG59_07280 [Candidatus Peribacteria bacterium]|jgi:hypothetical protein|nr:hypothetical protein [Candidatus Peribacteria bacterium]
MRSFSTFSFHSVSFDPQTLIATFTYQFDEELFTETINFSTSVRKIRPNLDDTVIHTILKHLHIAVGISYYKLSPTADILVPDWRTSELLQFRKTFYLNGLGEFMVVNGLSPNEICHFVNPSKPSSRELLQVSKPKD